ncbi:MAG: response regulator [Verrucomicrobiales bacterium]|jgi:chemotaxis family two-component system response regulator Rcp1|nr:response regulator [Verrucomicrobiales bacterium]
MLHILVVDDTHADLLLAEWVLRSCKILNPIRLLKSGADCIRYFEANEPTKSSYEPCIVFLDMIMSPMPGAAVLRSLRDSNLIGSSIIVILSGITDIKLIQEGYKLGAKTFLFKPIKSEDVLELINSLNGLVYDQETMDGNVLHWASTPLEKQLSDTEAIRRLGSFRTVYD